MYVIDRRLNPGGKSLANRQRFLRRAKALVRRAVRDDSKQRGIRDMEQGGEVSVPLKDMREPRLRASNQGGQREHILPGNKKFVEGDTVPRPPSGRGGGSKGSPDGEGEDDFRFVLSQEEYLDLFLDDLELPDLAKRRLATSESPSWRCAGYSVTGSPANFALGRTMRNSLSRRLALKRPKNEDIEALSAEAEALERSGADPARLEELRDVLADLVLRTRRISYIDPLDIRYRRFEPTPKPVAQAVMFCLMDVSGSMTEHMKDLAKRFYALLYIFLKRRYRHVDIVFIRHTQAAEEVDEDTFFHSAETGGTVVSTAFEEMARIVKQRYRPEDWNIYAAQASDGDNTPSDNAKTVALLTDVILPACQYFAYLEVGRDEDSLPAGLHAHPTDLWRAYEQMPEAGPRFAMRKVRHRRDIYPVFREFFRRRDGVVMGD